MPRYLCFSVFSKDIEYYFSNNNTTLLLYLNLIYPIFPLNILKIIAEIFVIFVILNDRVLLKLIQKIFNVSHFLQKMLK